MTIKKMIEEPLEENKKIEDFEKSQEDLGEEDVFDEKIEATKKKKVLNENKKKLFLLIYRKEEIN